MSEDVCIQAKDKDADQMHTIECDADTRAPFCHWSCL